ncbi:TPA: hypothetical protein ACK3Q6_003200 [Burkholderia cepacia]|uniref:hypothetical protein n=1 Tax=Burkholderia cepacia TaxID=292 RepID=UPI001CF39B35|nr:hypothetical protein [Burkholderia cepacia]MCA8358213.1 hypothetical protein [Burkholderia cepacia]HDR9759525.1 hypothetical protein [Burkholderia cepacia ATCC 25416]HDV6365816.1 hypothetical protein [Burkholderia cepacia]
MPAIRDLWLFAGNPQRLDEAAMDVRIAAESAGNALIRVHTVALDLFDEARTADALARSEADVIINTATMRSWFTLATALPAQTWREIYGVSRFGPWLPINLAPALAIMRASRAARPDAAVINVAFPDGVNPILARVGLAPTIGAGNSEIIASVLRIAAAEMLRTNVEEIETSLIGHHFHLANLDYDSAWEERAFWYRIRHRGDDVTETLTARGFKQVARRLCPHRSSVPAAVSAVRNTRRLLGEDVGRTVHCSAPHGLPGGFDVRFEGGRPSIALSDGITMDEARAVLHAAMQGDGIDAILDDGSVRMGASESDVMRRRFGYDCPVLRLNETLDRGRELLARFDDFSATCRS